MMIFDLRPFNEVNKPGFLQMVKTLQPKYNPGSDKYYRDLMQKTYTECRDKMMQRLVDANPQDVAMVLDGWSQFHHGYLGVNIHYINENWERKISTSEQTKTRCQGRFIKASRLFSIRASPKQHSKEYLMKVLFLLKGIKLLNTEIVEIFLFLIVTNKFSAFL